MSYVRVPRYAVSYVRVPCVEAGCRRPATGYTSRSRAYCAYHQPHEIKPGGCDCKRCQPLVCVCAKPDPWPSGECRRCRRLVPAFCHCGCKAPP